MNIIYMQRRTIRLPPQLFTINENNGHWTALLVYGQPRDMHAIYLNSSGVGDERLGAPIAQALNKAYGGITIHPVRHPRQQNGADCGIHAPINLGVLYEASKEGDPVAYVTRALAANGEVDRVHQSSATIRGRAITDFFPQHKQKASTKYPEGNWGDDLVTHVRLHEIKREFFERLVRLFPKGDITEFIESDALTQKLASAHYSSFGGGDGRPEPFIANIKTVLRNRASDYAANQETINEIFSGAGSLPYGSGPTAVYHNMVDSVVRMTISLIPSRDRLWALVEGEGGVQTQAMAQDLDHLLQTTVATPFAQRTPTQQHCSEILEHENAQFNTRQPTLYSGIGLEVEILPDGGARVLAIKEGARVGTHIQAGDVITGFLGQGKTFTPITQERDLSEVRQQALQHGEVTLEIRDKGRTTFPCGIFDGRAGNGQVCFAKELLQEQAVSIGRTMPSSMMDAAGAPGKGGFVQQFTGSPQSVFVR